MDEDALSKLAQFIIEHLGVKYVLQDRFHVAHCVSKWFNNSDPRFHYYVIVGWRHHTVTRRAKQEALVDAMLRRGEISKSRKGYPPIVKGTRSAMRRFRHSKTPAHTTISSPRAQWSSPKT